MVDGQIESVQNRLEFWYDQLPSVLRVDEPRQRRASPPPHILSLNLLYRALLLILFRHYQRHITGAVSVVQAHKLRFLEEQAALFHDLFILYCRTFQSKAHTSLVSYCVYTAATVDIGFIRIGSEEQRHAAALRLRAALKILEAEGKHTPGVKNSVDTIKKQIKNAATEREQRISGAGPQAISQQPSFEQAFATVDPTYRHHSIGSSSGTSQHEYETFSQGGHAQYIPMYSGFEVPQNTLMTQDSSAWQGSGHEQAFGGSYNAAMFGWNYSQGQNQEYASQMYGWPPTSHT